MSTPNKPAIHHLINFLLDLPDEKFNMNKWVQNNGGLDTYDDPDKDALVHDCGTVACIGGWTRLLLDPNTSTVAENVDYTGELLGLDRHDAFDLFYPYRSSIDWDNITREQAIQVLVHLYITGEVDWSIIK